MYVGHTPHLRQRVETAFPGFFDDFRWECDSRLILCGIGENPYGETIRTASVFSGILAGSPCVAPLRALPHGVEQCTELGLTGV
jgi:hypothetical protein